jgi:hypothetical protein
MGSHHVERVHGTVDVVARLRRLADDLEADRLLLMQTAGE